MVTFEEKATQHATHVKHRMPEQANPNHDSEVNSIPHSPHIAGNQAVQKLVQAESNGQEVQSATAASPDFKHGFSQIAASPHAVTNDLRLIAQNGTTGISERLPHLSEIQRSFGSQHDLSGVKAYIGGEAANAAEQMGAEAYTSGGNVAFRATPSLHAAAHEAAHVVQQKAGIRIPRDVGTKGDVYERQADAIADNVVAGRSSEHLLRTYAGAVGNRSVSSPAIQRLEQSLPYVGPLLSYLNPFNQLARAVLPGLSDTQKALLDGIFGNSLSTSVIRLNANSILGTGHCYRTTGNIINMPGSTIDDSHLIHEAAHVWQSQNTLFGVGYALSALRAQAVAQILGGDWQRAYDYHQVESHRIPWRYWNAEQQAQWIQDHRTLPSGWMLDAMIPDFANLPGTGLVNMESPGG